MTLQDGLAQHDLSVPVGEGGEGGRRGEIAGLDVIIKRPEALFESVGESLVVPPWVVRIFPDRGAQQRRVANQAFIRRVPVAHPELVGCFTAPGQSALGT